MPSSSSHLVVVRDDVGGLDDLRPLELDDANRGIGDNDVGGAEPRLVLRLLEVEVLLLDALVVVEEVVVEEEVAMARASATLASCQFGNSSATKCRKRSR